MDMERNTENTHPEFEQWILEQLCVPITKGIILLESLPKELHAYFNNVECVKIQLNEQIF